MQINSTGHIQALTTPAIRRSAPPDASAFGGPPRPGDRPDPGTPLRTLGVAADDLGGLAAALGQTTEELAASLGDDPTIGDVMTHVRGAGLDPRLARSAFRSDVVDAGGVGPRLGPGTAPGMGASGPGRSGGQAQSMAMVSGLPAADQLNLLIEALGGDEGARPIDRDRLVGAYERFTTG